MRIGIDVDGVIADNHTPWLARINREQGTSWNDSDLTQWHFWHDLGLQADDVVKHWTPDIYSDVLPYPGAQEALRKITAAGHEVVYITTCSSSLEWQYKDAWLGRHGFYFPKAMAAAGVGQWAMYKSKAEVATELKVDWLVDDHVVNCEQWPRYALLLTRPHNKNISTTVKRIKSLDEVALLLPPAAIPQAAPRQLLKPAGTVQTTAAPCHDFAGAVDGGGYKASMDDTTKLPLWLVPPRFYRWAMSVAWPRSEEASKVTDLLLLWIDGGEDTLLETAAQYVAGQLGGGPQGVRAVAEVLRHGAKKYAANNWRRGMKWSEVASAALRHLLAVDAGEKDDADSGLLHLAHAGCCIAFLLEYTQYPQLYAQFDDRFKRPVQVA